MRLTEHPEYHRVYQNNRQIAERCQQAIAQWKASNTVISVSRYSLHWSYQEARSFVQALSRFFQAYNSVLWQHFHYCRACGGKCCVVDASNVQPFDLLSIALLERSALSLPQNITAQRHECIYLSNRRCSWPDEWRTIKCWSFYCLGVGPWRPETPISKLRHEIIAELQQVVSDFLPEALHRYEVVERISLAEYLDDPVAFSEALHRALFKLFVGPFNAAYPILDTQAVQSSPTERAEAMTPIDLLQTDEVSIFIAEALDEICEDPPAVPHKLPVSLERFLADLEALQWIIEGHPQNELQLLKEMALRYAGAPSPCKGEAPGVWYRMQQQLLKLSGP